MRASRSLPWEQCPWGFVALKAFVLWAVARVLSYGVSKSQALCRAPCWGWVLREEVVAPPGVTRGLPGGMRKVGERYPLSLAQCVILRSLGQRSWETSWRRRHRAKCSICGWNR